MKEEATSSAWTLEPGYTAHRRLRGTYPCGEVSEEAMRLIEVTRQSFFEGIKFAKPGYRYRISDMPSRNTLRATVFPWCGPMRATA